MIFFTYSLLEKGKVTVTVTSGSDRMENNEKKAGLAFLLLLGGLCVAPLFPVNEIFIGITIDQLHSFFEKQAANRDAFSVAACFLFPDT